MDSRKSVTTEICAILCIDSSNFFYRACSLCERTLPEDHPASRCCIHCANRYATSASAGSKLLFRVLMSIATDEKVFNVICFDRVARALFGCSADEFWDFARLHPFATAAANRVLEGELFRMSLSTPKNGNAQHLRVTSVVPVRSEYRPVIEYVRQLKAVMKDS
ncbi:hypothetical protein SAY86_009146 [Trapa natans]|uniref:Replication factor A C-terminal domain-containing protein n=1 Tax=Trapa natans TaxID=22666 RepID=A0AAN7K7L6_TRANT|nr:hypothetical protein SAY86_009146 [Trapa natans]